MIDKKPTSNLLKKYSIFTDMYEDLTLTDNLSLS